LKQLQRIFWEIGKYKKFNKNPELCERMMVSRK
jgi:hypothetical protein